MNPLFEAARQGLTHGALMGALTVFFAAVFVGFLLWAWWPGRKAAMEAMARLPIEDDEGGAL